MCARCDAFGTIAFLTKPLQDTALFAATEKARRVTAKAGTGAASGN